MLEEEDQNKTLNKSDNATWIDESKNIGKKKWEIKNTEKGSSNKIKTGHFAIMKENSTYK